MKYRIVGADGKIYGSVELEQLRQWLAQRRVDSRTPVFLDGAADWTFIGLLPELAGAPGVPPPGIAPAKAAAAPRGTNGFATAGLVCGLLSWVCCCCVPLNVVGVILSIIALVQIHSQPEPQEGRSLAIAGLVLCGANLLLSLGLGLLQMLLNPGSFSVHINGL
jgi:Domain of unknown function (DUF4190)